MAEPNETPDVLERSPRGEIREEMVRIRLALGDIVIAFEGRRAYYESHVEPLIAQAYRRAAQRGAFERAAASLGASAGQGNGQVGEHAEASLEATSPDRGPVFTPSSPQRFKQFASHVGDNATTVEQRVMVFAFYLWNYERQDEFTSPDLEAFFRTVHEEPPAGLGQLLVGLADGKRFVEPGTAAEAWRLTTKGVNYVKNRLLSAD